MSFKIGGHDYSLGQLRDLQKADPDKFTKLKQRAQQELGHEYGEQKLKIDLKNDQGAITLNSDKIEFAFGDMNYELTHKEKAAMTAYVERAYASGKAFETYNFVDVD